MFDHVISHLGKPYDFITLDPTCVAALTVWLGLSEPHYKKGSDASLIIMPKVDLSLCYHNSLRKTILPC